ncbi:GNAT family N-acetyltransferase [Halopenitus sp. POP-27]|uniref:GNAT family N-acetyltransferase n=1 Tax=Halopenitus sp. POP-27 TaxID=2994425 RepID=UPI002468BF7F|nr:GNAT family N-acetyltransferase [Halopenitus sp. POP-27]
MSRPVDPTIREVSRADLLSVVRIERAVFSDPWPYDAFERLLDAPAFLVAELDASTFDSDRRDAIDSGAPIAGYVVADMTPDFGRDIGHIKDIAVHPDVQGNGIGSQLLRSALARLRFRGAAVVKLEVRASNGRARSLYSDHGFTPMRRVSRYYNDGEDAVVMVLDLEDWTPP